MNSLFYLNVENEKIISCSNADITSGSVKSYPVSQEVYYSYITYPDKYLFRNGAIVEDETWAAREAAREKERIGNLTCTKRVLVLMLQDLQYSWKDHIKPLIYSNPDAEVEWELCVELQRKNPLLDLMGEQLGITPNQIDKLFQAANSEITQEEFLAAE